MRRVIAVATQAALSPGAREHPAMMPLDAALALATQGYAVHWLQPRNKRPVAEGWSEAPTATPATLQATYHTAYNVGVRCGHWSQPRPGHGLVVIDVDIKRPAAEADALEALLPDSLLVPVVLSGGGNGSRHLWFTCPLSLLPPKAAITIRQGPGWKLEVLSTGKQLVVAPSLHPDTGNRCRWLVSLNSSPPRVPEAVLDAVSAARVRPVTVSEASRQLARGDRPGDAFNSRADWCQILEPHGWRPVAQRGDVTHWCRPGKAHGTSATSNYASCGLLYVFSSNAAPLEADTAYSPFAAYAYLEHNGDFRGAAEVLQQQGYGKRPTLATRRRRRFRRWLRETPS